MARLLTLMFAALVLVGVVSGCANNPPIKMVGVRVLLLCVANCPVTVNLANEGRTTDAVAQELPHLLPENFRAVRG